MPTHDIARQLPLTPAVVEILLVLAEQARQGSDIPRAIAERNEGQFTLEHASTYRYLQSLLAEGLVAEASDRLSAQRDPRAHTYRLTRLGRTALLREAGRLASVVSAAERARLAPPGFH